MQKPVFKISKNNISLNILNTHILVVDKKYNENDRNNIFIVTEVKLQFL